MSLEGKVALVTGGGRGLGRMFALRLASLGAKVAVLDRDLHSFALDPDEAASMTADSVMSEIKNAGGEAIGIEADVTDRPALREAVAQINDRLGAPVSIAVANAGGGGWGHHAKLEQPASDVDIDDARRRFEANVFGTMNTVAVVAPGMKAARYGKIVTLGSISGLIARPDGSHADYGAAKAAVAFYTRSAANELGPFGITVNCLAPGLTMTPRLDAKYSDIKAQPELTQNVAMNRLGTPEDCARVLEFLVTDLSDYVTGEVVPVAGGTRLTRWGPPPTPWR